MTPLEWIVPEDGGAQRIDTFLAATDPSLSRSRWQALVKDGSVLLNGASCKPNQTVQPGDQVTAAIPEPEETALTPEDIPLKILYEDSALLALDKPAGMVVHPAPGHDTGTLVHALLHHCVDLAGVGGERRPGIVHRLDRDTSGVMVVAKNDTAMMELARQFKSRETEKIYLAIVKGVPAPASGTIDTLMGRNPGDRKKMSVNPPSGKPAVTHYKVSEALPGAAFMEIRIETGRTHQIRVHMTHIGHPVAGDPVYGKSGLDRIMIPRQMLHASSLALKHPSTGKPLVFTAPVPEDMTRVLEYLREQQGTA